MKMLDWVRPRRRRYFEEEQPEVLLDAPETRISPPTLPLLFPEQEAHGRGRYCPQIGTKLDRLSRTKATSSSQTEDIEKSKLCNIVERCNSALSYISPKPVGGNVFCSKAKVLIDRVFTHQKAMSRALGDLIPALSDHLKTTSTILGVTEATLRKILSLDDVAEHGYAIALKPQHFQRLPPCNKRSPKKQTAAAKGEQLRKQFLPIVPEKIRWMVHERYQQEKRICISTFNEELKIQLEEFDYNLSDRSLCRLLNAIGFRYRKIRDRCVLFERRDLIDWRHRYLKKIKELRSKNAFIAYSDETWLFEVMRYGFDWVDTDAMNDPRKYMKRGWKLNPSPAASRGKRGIVVGVIAEEGLVDGTFKVWAECGMSDDEDYHKSMDSALYEEWLGTVLPMIKAAANGREAVLVVDNAPYHSQLVEQIPCASSKKKIIVDFLTSRNVSCSLTMKKKQLWELFCAFADAQGGAID